MEKRIKKPIYEKEGLKKLRNYEINHFLRGKSKKCTGSSAPLLLILKKLFSKFPQ